MKKYIDVNALLEHLVEAIEAWDEVDKDRYPVTFGMSVAFKNIFEYVEEQPTAEMIEVRHGTWKKHFAYGSWHYDCSICNDGFATGEEFRIEQMPNYCSNCGAKMDKVVTDKYVGGKMGVKDNG